ncbi:MAG: peptidylprolyl isomerase [Burkholderiales bacterium]|jgi:peptidyl-prolyl cis-trans isomerase SurA|nr:peptidylprolyl isomerase [Burkholderiales bacterium]
MKPYRTPLSCLFIAAVAGALSFTAHATDSPAAAASAPPQTPPPQTQTQTQASTAATSKMLDRIILIVNEEAVTRYDIEAQKNVILKRMKAANVTPPPEGELEHQIIERLITEKALMQFAKETGIRVDDTMIDRAINSVAQDNKMTLDELREALAKENIPFPFYREELRKQVTLQRLRDREVDSHTVVTDAEVDAYIKLIDSQAGGENEYLISHILVSVPNQASPELIDERHTRAEEILKRLRDGADFAQAAVATSDASDALTGGSLDWRTLARLPTLFADAVRDMKKDQISGILRSPAGFHILKLNDTRSRNEPKVVEQTHARHILARVSETTSEEDARQKIERARQRIEGGETFETVARLMSEDASSSRGGDLGWLNPGDTVPDFERAMNALQPGKMSEIIRTPFGWHLIEVLERRQQDITKEHQHEQARQALRQRKSDEAFEDFLMQTRDRAYVEYKTNER